MKPGDYSKKVLRCLFISIVVFFLINQYTFLKTGVEQTEMIRMMFLTVFGELFSMAGIKITKVFKNARSEVGIESEDNNGFESDSQYSDSNSFDYSINSDVEKRV